MLNLTPILDDAACRPTERERKARYRKRQRDGRIAVTVEVGPEVLDLLITCECMS